MKELAWEIAETAHALRRSYDRRAAEYGVTRAQWRVIAFLGREPGLKQVELADFLDVEPITLCRIIDRLEEAGMVERQRDPADRRAWRLYLTPAAQPLLIKLRGLAEEMAALAFAGMSAGDVAAMGAALARIRQNVAAMGDDDRKMA